VSLLLTGVAIEGARRENPFMPDKRPDSSDEEIAQAWAKHDPNPRADKVSEHVCRLICLCIGYRVSGEISGGDSATGLDRVLASMRIQKREFDDVTNTYGSLV
jgi:hypothetical protein